MWMQKSVEGGGPGGMNLHDRNRFAQSSPYASTGYSGGGGGLGAGAGDWKSKILESGQWLGGKVIEYGGKLARGSGNDSAPEHMRGVPYNDGRASWMADIRNSSFTNTNYQGGGGGGGGFGGATYQNDFATERPKAYSDYSSGGYRPSSSSSAAAVYDHSRSGGPALDRGGGRRHSHDASGRRAKKKSESSKKGKKKSRSAKKRRNASSSSEASESESESESDTASAKESLSDASLSSDSASARRKTKATKKHAKKKDAKKKKSSSFYSEDEEEEEEESDGSQPVRKSKSKKADKYAYSFDPSKLPPPPEEKSKKSAKEPKASRSKKGSKSRGRRQSVESSDSDVQPDSEKSKHGKRSAKKTKDKAAVDESVDLLGVDFAPQPATNATTTLAYAQPQAASSSLLTSVFDEQQSTDPLHDLAGLSFDAPAPSTHQLNNESAMMFGAQEQQQQQQQQQADESRRQGPAGARFLKTLLPENDIVDLSVLASEKKPEKLVAAQKKTLNDLQKSTTSEQPVSVMSANPHAVQQQQMMYQMGQMQLGHPAAMPMQMQMQPMQMPSQQQQQQQQQQMMMMSAQMMQQQQRQQLLMQQQQQQQMMQNQSQPDAGVSSQGGAMFSSFQQ